jgi:hypothetical protein
MYILLSSLIFSTSSVSSLFLTFGLLLLLSVAFSFGSFYFRVVRILTCDNQNQDFKESLTVFVIPNHQLYAEVWFVLF